MALGEGASRGANAAGSAQEKREKVTAGGNPVGSGRPQPRQYGSATFADPLLSAGAAASSPEYAAAMLRAAQGLRATPTSRLGKFRDSLYGPMLAAYLNLSGLGGGGGGQGAQADDFGAFLAAMEGGNLIPALRQQAGQVLGGGLGAMDDAAFEDALGYATALGGVGVGSVGQNVLDFGLESLLDTQQREDILRGGMDTPPLQDLFANAPFRSALQRYLAAVQAR